MLSDASFLIAFVSLLVAIAAFMFGNTENKQTRGVLGSIFLLLAIISGFIGLFSSAGNTETPFGALGSDNAIEAYCAFVTRAQMQQLQTIQGVQNAITQAEIYSGHSQNDYRVGDPIPQGVMIATDLRTTNIQQFGVTAINNQGGWGLFLTTRQFVAPNDGTYWCIR